MTLSVRLCVSASISVGRYLRNYTSHVHRSVLSHRRCRGCYVLPVVWMTPCLYTVDRRRNSDSAASGMGLSPWRIFKMTHEGQHRGARH